MTLLRVVQQFVFGCLRLPHFFHSYFMTNDFLIFRQEEVYQTLVKVMQSTQKIVMSTKAEVLPQVMHGLVFDCYVFLPEFRDSPQTDQIDSGKDTSDPIFSKIAYLFKREISSSTVADHQNSLIYNIRENSLISEFFGRLSGMIISLDEIYLSDLVCRLSRFSEETFDCLLNTGFKMMASYFRSDFMKVLAFMNVSLEMSKVDAMRLSAEKLLAMGLAYSILAIYKDRGIDIVPLQNHIATRVDGDLFEGFRSCVTSFSYLTAASKLTSSARLKPLAENRLMMEGYLYEASIQERQLDFIKKHMVLLVDSNCIASSKEFFELVRHLCNHFRHENNLDDFLMFLRDFKSSVVFEGDLKPKTAAFMVWRCFVYLKMISENSDINLDILKLYSLFVRHEFRIVEGVFSSKYLDRIIYLSSTLTTVAREVSISSHSSLADALKSFMTEEEDSEIASPELRPRETMRDLDNFNLTFIRKQNFSFEEVLLDKCKVYSDQSVLEHLKYVVDLIVTINLAKSSFRLMVYLLEYSVDLICRKESSSVHYYRQCLSTIDKVFAIENIQDDTDRNEKIFKEKFRLLKDGIEISTLLRNYFKFKINLKALHTAPEVASLEELQDLFSAVTLGSTAYISLMITAFETSVKQLLFRLSAKMCKVSSWQTIFKLLLYIKRHVAALRDRLDSTDDSLNRLEGILTDVSNNIKINPAIIDTDIILVTSHKSGIHRNDVYILSVI